MHRIGIAAGTLLLLAACVSPPPRSRFVAAKPEPSAPRVPAVVQVSRPLPLPGQLRRIPNASADSPDKLRSAPDIVANANRRAAAGPAEDAYFNAIMTYDYVPGALYQIYSAPLRLTTVQLQPGEKILGKPASGDIIRWILGLGHSAQGGLEQQNVYIKPTRAGLHTTITVMTDRRTYFLEVHSYEETYMAAVQWRYPQDEINAIEADANRRSSLDAATTATNLSLDSLNFAYRVKVEKGSPRWAPVQIFDDGKKTFIRFPRSILNREAPTLFVLSSQKDTQLVNYRVKNEYYVVDRLFDAAELRVGQKEQEVVRIYRDR